ncbi:MAG TPA: acyl-CoA thioester hydrolase/BAAT C-terminal domain-containing protein [Candidatus Binataceae bacterium]|nr:acyl-CoA thioester hydrolase/BAAT C-terminal domain-containing protein [Candidatus Binataceae bacterium]
MDVHEQLLTGEVQGALLTPERPGGLGVIVLGGSSGRVDVARASLFASRGATALALRWFGGAGQSPVIAEIPLERFIAATDRLIDLGCDRIAFVGTSRGAEAALLVAIEDPRVDVAVAISPSSVVWAGDVWPPRSSWTRNGTPLPFVHYDVENMPVRGDQPVSYRRYAESSLARFADEVPAASIAIENARAQVALVAGADDALWPSDVCARALADRLTATGKNPVLVTHPDAGHRVLLPGETTPRSTLNAHGGNDDADRALGAAAWTAIELLLRFPSP